MHHFALESKSIDSCNQIHLTLAFNGHPAARASQITEALKSLQDRSLHAIWGTALSRTDRQTLERASFLEAVIRGWYIPKRPNDADANSIPWYASMREFVAGYASERFGERWHLNPEQSSAPCVPPAIW